MTDDVEIIIEEYDKKHMIAFVEKKGKCMFISFLMCEFAAEMEYWDINMTYGEKNGRKGFIFEKDDVELIKTEIKNFIDRYNLSEHNY